MKTVLSALLMLLLVYSTAQTQPSHPHVNSSTADDGSPSPAGFSRWQTQMVDRVAAGAPLFNPSLALDSSGHPHISYFDDGRDAVKYARLDGAAWKISTVEIVKRGGEPALALDAANRPHVSYAIANEGLRYAWYDGSIWHRMTVERGDVGANSSLALDVANRPHISYYDWVSQSLKYAQYNGTNWQIIAIDGGEGNPAGYESSLALDVHGWPHISYRQDATLDDPHFKLKYAWFDGVAWKTEVIEDRGLNDSPSLALDRSGQPHICYMHDDTAYPSQNPRLKYAWRDASGWHTEIVERGGYNGALALDSRNQPHVSYYWGTLVKYAWHDRLGWHTELVENVADWGQPSLALDLDGNIAITYSFDKNELKYAVKHPIPDLSLSTITANTRKVAAGAPITYTARLINLSPVFSATYTLTDPIPAHTTYVSGSAWASSGQITDTNGIRWTGIIDPSTIITATVMVTTDITLSKPTGIVNNATLVGDPSGPLDLRAVTFIDPYEVFLSLIVRD